MDIEKLSFAIKGSAQGAISSLGNLITKLTALDTSFTQASKSGESFATVLGNIAQLSRGAGAGLGTTATKARTTSNAMTKVSAITQKASSQLSMATAKSTGLSASMNTLTKHTNASSNTMSKLIQRITQITFIVYVARRAMSAFGTGILTSIAYVENLNLFMVALGKNTSRATGFIQEMSSSLYLDEAQLTRVQGLFYQISESLGLGSEKAYKLSENFTKLAYDLASFYNITIDAAVTKLQAGLVGETEPLRRIGIIITENNLAETARNIGIKKSIRNMTEQEKIQLRYVTALQQTKTAQGDMARTLEQPENLLRILKEQFNVLMRELGNVAIPVIKQLIPQVIGLTMALSKLASSWALSMGYEVPAMSDELGGHMKTVADESDKVSASTAKMAKNLAKVLKYTRETSSSMTGIDELNVINDSSSTSAVDDLFPSDDLANATSSINIALKDYNNNMETSAGLFQKIITKWETLFAKMGTTFNGVFNNTKIAIDKLKTTLFGKPLDEDEALGGVAKALRIIDTVVAGVITGVANLADHFEKLYNDFIKPIFEALVPDWIADLTSGDSSAIVKAIAGITEALLILKGITIGVGVISALKNIITIGGMVGGPTGLLALFAAMGAITIAFDVADAFKTGEWEEVGKQLVTALLLGLGVGAITGSGKLASIVIPIVFAFDLDFATMNRKLIEAGLDKVLGTKDNPNMLGKFFQWMSDVADSISTPSNKKPEMDGKFTISGERTNLEGEFYANGGSPNKGNLFVAGEKGPELVTEHNGQTVVMNERQLKDRGVDFFANGVNVPKWTDEERRRAGGSAAITSDLNALFGALPKLIASAIKKVTPTGGKFTAGASQAIWMAKQFAEQSNTFWSGLKGTDMVKGIVSTFSKFKEQLKDGTGALGTMSKVVSKTGKGVAIVLANAFSLFKESSVRQIMSKTASDGGTTAQQQGVAGDVIGGALGDSTLGNIFNIMQHIADGSLGAFVDSLPMFVEAGMDMIVNLITGVVAALPELMKSIPMVITKIVDLLTNKDSLNAIISGLINAVGIIVTYLPDIMFSLAEAIPDIVMTLIKVFIENLPLFLKLGVAIGVAILEGIANLLISGVNLIIRGINALIPGSKWDIRLMKSADFSALMPTFAEGGYPTQGQMFIAREAGAELVGNIGGSTAVANNDQIVQAVSDGVYRAVLMANREQGQQKVLVTMDGRRMSDALDQAGKTRGLAFGTGGY